MALANEHFFSGPKARFCYLAARGFDEKTGARSGGIVAPKQVVVPAATPLIRLHLDAGKTFGAWWTTVHEMALICAHFARSSRSLDAGRSRGRGAMQAVLAVRHDWAGGSPQQLSRYTVAALKEPLMAYHGDGDDAPDASQTRVQKAVRILADGVHRPVRQLFFPSCWDYASAFDVLRTGDTRGDLLAAVRAFDEGAAAFER